MKLKRITIEGLFNLYSYDVVLNDSGLTILTGPNGYGKTTILSIISYMYKKNFYYFCTLIFKEISFEFENGYKIFINKSPREQKGFDHPSPELTNTVFGLFIDEKEVSTLYFDLDSFFKNIGRRYQRKNDDLWEDTYEDHFLTTLELIDKEQNILERVTAENKESNELLLFLHSLNMCFIEEKRLSITLPMILSRSERRISKTTPTILQLADELAGTITQVRLKSLEIAQKLESTFPERLLETTRFLTNEEYKLKLNHLQPKLALLRKFGLSDMYLSTTEYTGAENKKILTVYLNDAEEKTLHLDELLAQIQLFVQIINKKQFASKTFHVNAKNGFYFKSIHDKEIKLDQLSSGEQHEVIMIYELLFHSIPNTLVLIDEPEISLHVAWQQEFIDDMLETTKMRKLDLIVATHSPQIIGNKWELCKDLYELNR